MRARKRVALVTGGGRGIGLGCARELARRGFDIALCGRRDGEEVAKARESIEKLGARVLYAVCDVGDSRQRDALLDAIRVGFGHLDVLINNAGVAPAERRDLLDATEKSFERLLRINLQGPYFLTQAAARWMLEQREKDDGFRGCIVNVSSVSATMASINRGEYCISKAGVAMATRLWAVRLAEAGIAVYEVRPGIVATDMTEGVRDKYDHLIAEGLVPEGRWGTPEDVGRAVASLASGDLPYSTGSVIHVDGGLALPRL